MIKLMVASDIHGSAYYCKKMLEAFDREQAERLLLLGDILYHGPRNDLPKEYDPKEVIKMLNERKNRIFCVRGNCDTEVDQMVLEFPILADYAIIPTADHLIYAAHGHHFNLKQLPSASTRGHSPPRTYPHPGLGIVRRRKPVPESGFRVDSESGERAQLHDPTGWGSCLERSGR